MRRPRPSACTRGLRWTSAAAVAVALAGAGVDLGAHSTGGGPAAAAADRNERAVHGERAETAQARERPLARTRGRRPRVQTIATGLRVPWEIAFLPDGRALITERPGRVRLLSAGGRLRSRPVGRIAVSARGEGGLLGLAVDPAFRRNRFVYAYYTTRSGMRVARYRFARNRLRRQAIVLGGISAGTIHDSGRIHFGPDGGLYVSTGDAGRPGLAQSHRSLNGKFLRLGPSAYRGRGGRPRIVSRGHRNPQGFDWQPGSGRLIATEHGPDGDDEVNHIRTGRNYGWPEARGRDHRGFAAPLTVYPRSVAPSGATFVSLPGSAWTGDYLFAALRGRQLRRLGFRGTRVVRNQVLFEGRFGRLRTVVEGPDGALYLLTNNTDGRGSPRPGDDRLLRVVPPGR